ncbi:Uncharacterised protein [Vibrio cholerae]|uniref:Uncharacterized protein n=1 Tax=Vibrio cholerae TaxID=666 RepID=A0A655RI00_VIBCL|nr:Uncharacterised protein [Vibrio cholerae]CSC74204.1 Uncharacterised protein [Vibrio cholerae]
MLGDNTRQQIALSRDHFAIFIGVFIEQIRIAFLDQTFDLFGQLALLLTRDIAVMAIFNV